MKKYHIHISILVLLFSFSVLFPATSHASVASFFDAIFSFFDFVPDPVAPTPTEVSAPSGIPKTESTTVKEIYTNTNGANTADTYITNVYNSYPSTTIYRGGGGSTSGLARSVSRTNSEQETAITALGLRIDALPVTVSSQWTTSGSDIYFNTGNVGVGTTTPAAFFHVLGTTEQQRIGYNASNYYKTTVGSTGSVTFDAVGSGSKFIYADVVDIGTTASTKTSISATGGAITLGQPSLGGPGAGVQFDYFGGAIFQGNAGYMAGLDDSGAVTWEIDNMNGNAYFGFANISLSSDTPFWSSNYQSLNLQTIDSSAGTLTAGMPSINGDYTVYLNAFGSTGKFEFLNDETNNLLATISLGGLTMGTGDIFNRAGLAATPSYSFSTDTDTGMYRAGVNSIGFSTGGVGRLTIETGGYVLVGPSLIDGTSYSIADSAFNITQGSPLLASGAVVAQGGLNTNTTHDGLVSLLVIPFGGGTSDIVNVYDSVSDPALFILSDGKTGIGTSTPSQKLVVAGTIQSTGLLGGATTLSTDASGNIIRTPSDGNLKENVEPLEGALEKLLQLEGVSYDFKNPNFGTGRQIGFIAQDVKTIFPEVVSSGGDYLSLNYGNLVAVVVEAVKELATKVTAMAEHFTTKKVTTDKLCVTKSDGGEVCLTGDELQDILGEESTPVSDPEPDTDPTPDPDPVPEEEPSEEEPPIVTDPIVIEEPVVVEEVVEEVPTI